MSTNTNNSLRNEITKLQTEQLNLQNTFKELPYNNTFSRQSRNISKINDKMHETLTVLNNFNETLLDTNIANNNNETLLDSKNETLNIVNQQLNIANTATSRMHNENINNNRQIEINNFYNGHYLLYLNIFRYLIYTCTFLLIVALFKQFGGISVSISNILTIIIIVIAGYFIITAIIDLNYRNNLEITEYDFYTNPNTDDVPSYESNQDSDLTILQDLENKYNCLKNN